MYCFITEKKDERAKCIRILLKIRYVKLLLVVGTVLDFTIA